MPGLIRAAARTAVIAGTATSVSNRVARRQANRWAQQDYQNEQRYSQPAPPAQPAAPAAVPAPAAPPAQDTIEQLKELGALYQQGILTEQEFAAQKAKILGA